MDSQRLIPFGRHCVWSAFPALAQPALRSFAGPAADAHRRLFWLRSTAGGRSASNPAAMGVGGLRSAKIARLEAVLFVSDGALSARRLAQLATLADAAEAVAIIDQLNAHYDAEQSPFRIERAANGYLLLTRPIFSRWLSRLHQRQSDMKLTASAMETLTVVAYRQPLTRADMETIRGVQSSEMLRQLMERGLVRIAGEDNSLGRPYLYETTRKFLEVFGLRSLDELPLADRVRRITPKMPAGAPAVIGMDSQRR